MPEPKPCEVGDEVHEAIRALPLCDGHWGPGSLRAWAECPVCNPPEEDHDV